MGIFGWSYPPGCSGPPEEDYDEPTECAECGGTLTGKPGREILCSVECEQSYQKRQAEIADGEAKSYFVDDICNSLAELQGLWIGEWEPPKKGLIERLGLRTTEALEKTSQALRKLRAKRKG